MGHRINIGKKKKNKINSMKRFKILQKNNEILKLIKTERENKN
jgi:hypothetical protein